MKVEIYPQIFEETQISNLMKIRAVGAKLFHIGAQADRQAYMTKLVVVFRNFANVPNKRYILSYVDC